MKKLLFRLAIKYVVRYCVKINDNVKDRSNSYSLVTCRSRANKGDYIEHRFYHYDWNFYCPEIVSELYLMLEAITPHRVVTDGVKKTKKK
jgi:hypothetical protein